MNDQTMRYLHRQFRALMPIMLLAYVPALAALIGVVFLAFTTGRHIWFFTTDTFVLGNLPFYAGILSNVGILLWCATAAICFFCAAVLKGDDPMGVWRLFLCMSGVLTSLLLFDDLFQMHKIFYPILFHLSEILVYGMYGLFAFWYLIYFRKQIRETEFLLLVFALVFFVLAVIFDTFNLLRGGNTAFSDGLKLLGIVSWFTYFIRTCWKATTEMQILNPKH
jgi:hypothetical protein